MARDQVGGIMSELTNLVEDSVKGLGRDLTLNLKTATPRDTGLAGSSWQLSIGKPAEPVAVGQRSPAGVRRAAEAQQKGLDSLTRYRLAQGNVIITNSQPYISQLNLGHSGQAPSGFVQRTVLRTTRQTAGKRRA